MEIQNDNDSYIAEYTTVTNSIENIDKTSNSSDAQNKVAANPQLYFWIEAKNRYFEKVKTYYHPAIDDLIFIVNCLGISLSHLFGQNYPGNENGYTPPLLTLVDSFLPSQGMRLKVDYQNVYYTFKELNIYYCDVTKHPDRSKKLKILSLTKSKIDSFLEATRLIWIWFGLKKYGNILSDDALSEFKYQFTELK